MPLNMGSFYRGQQKVAQNPFGQSGDLRQHVNATKQLRDEIDKLVSRGNLKKASVLLEKLTNVKKLHNYIEELRVLQKDLNKAMSKKNRQMVADLQKQIADLGGSIKETTNEMKGFGKETTKTGEVVGDLKNKILGGGAAIFGGVAFGKGFFEATGNVLELRTAVLNYGDALDEIDEADRKAVNSLVNFQYEAQRASAMWKAAQYGVPAEAIKDGVSKLIPLQKQLGLSRDELHNVSLEVSALGRLLRQDGASSMEFITNQNLRFGKSVDEASREMAVMRKSIETVSKEFSGTGGLGITTKDFSDIMFDLNRNTKSYVINNDVLSLSLSRISAGLTKQGMAASRVKDTISGIGSLLTGDIAEYKKYQIGDKLFGDLTEENFKEKIKGMKLGDNTKEVMDIAEQMIKSGYKVGSSFFSRSLFEKVSASGLAQQAIFEDMRKLANSNKMAEFAAAANLEFKPENIAKISELMQGIKTMTPAEYKKLRNDTIKDKKDPTNELLDESKQFHTGLMSKLRSIRNILQSSLGQMGGGATVGAGGITNMIFGNAIDGFVQGITEKFAPAIMTGLSTIALPLAAGIGTALVTYLAATKLFKLLGFDKKQKEWGENLANFFHKKKTREEYDAHWAKVFEEAKNKKEENIAETQNKTVYRGLKKKSTSGGVSGSGIATTGEFQTKGGDLTIKIVGGADAVVATGEKQLDQDTH